MKRDKPALTEQNAVSRAADFLGDFESLKAEEYKSVGVGIERRFQAKGFTGFELQYESRVIHLTALGLDHVKPQSTWTM